MLHAGCCRSAARLASDCRHAFARIVAADARAWSRTRLVWKTRVEFAQSSCPCHWAPLRARRMWPAARLLYIIWGSLGQRDKPHSYIIFYVHPVSGLTFV